MSTILPPPIVGDWKGARIQRLGGDQWAFDLEESAQILRLVYDRLVPGHKIQVRLIIRAKQTASNVTVRIGSYARHWRRIQLIDEIVQSDQFGPSVTIDLEGIRKGTVEVLTIIDETPIPANPRPCDVLSLQALYPLQGLDGLRWNQSRWNRESWTRGAENPTYLQWNLNSWNTRTWHSDASQTMAWQDITGPCTEITVTRGVESTGPALTAQVGTLTARAVNGLAPRATGMYHGTPIRLLHWPTREYIFTGYLTDLAISPHKPGSRIAYETTLTASDNVARLAAITRYGAKSDERDGSENWVLRIDRLTRTCRDLIYWLDTRAHAQRVPPIVWETNLAKHLDAAVSSVLGSWTVNRNGEVAIRTTRPRIPRVRFTDAIGSAPAAGIWSYTAVQVAWSAADAIAQITLKNHSAKWDSEQSEWRADDTEVTVSDPTAATVWGGAAVQVDVTLPIADLESVARRYLATVRPDPMPSALTVQAAHASGPSNRAIHMSAAATFDPITAARVEYRGEEVNALITQVAHFITPYEWKTQLQLTNNQEGSNPQ